MSGIRSSVLRISSVVLQGTEDVGELSKHVEAEEWWAGLHKGRNSDQESPQANSESVADEADTKPVQHCCNHACKTDEEEHYDITESTRFPQQHNAGCWYSGKL